MTSRHLSLAVGVILAAGVALVVAQQSSQTPSGITVTGCVRQGSAPAVFILRAASEAIESDAGAPQDYLLVSVPSRVDLSAHLNHKMEITGEKSEAAPPAGANAAERALPRIAVSDGHEVSPTCAEPNAAR